MFTGIVMGTAAVAKVEPKEGYHTLWLRLPSKEGLAIGASVAIDGVCLTVTSLAEDLVSFDIIDNSLKITTLDSLQTGSLVNYERSFSAGAEIGGHILSGHVDFSGKVSGIYTGSANHGLTISVEPQWSAYIFPKGFIAINGCSLTVSEVDRLAHTFTVWLIPETLRVTNIGALKVNSLVNIEIDRQTQVLVDTVRSVAEEKFGALQGLLMEALGKTRFMEDMTAALRLAQDDEKR